MNYPIITEDEVYAYVKKHSPLTIFQLQAHFKVNQSTVLHHLRMLLIGGKIKQKEEFMIVERKRAYKLYFVEG